MSILSDAWRRARGEEDAVTRALGAPPATSAVRRGHWLPWLLCGLLLVVVIGLGVYLWRSHRLSQIPSQPSPAAAGKPGGAGSGAARVAVKSGVVAPASRVAAKTGAPAVRSAPQPVSAGPAAGGAATAPASAPEAVRAQLPPLAVTVHVWNPRPAARFVVVDGRIYHEGDELQPGLRLVRITREGEIVEFQGYRITLSGH